MINVCFFICLHFVLLFCFMFLFIDSAMQFIEYSQLLYSYSGLLCLSTSPNISNGRNRTDVAEYFQCLASTENDLNHILSTFVESEHEIENLCDSRYIELSDITSIIKDDGKHFIILTLNFQSINAKFDNLYPVINNLSSIGLYFGAICLQETRLSSDADVSLLQIPGYKLIHQGSRCTRHGGLVIYLHEQYTYKLRNMYTRSDIWEGLFIDVSGHNLHRPITIGNIYRPPHNNNNNANIENFFDECHP